MLGGARAQYHLRQIMVFLDATVMNLPEVMVAQAQSKIDAASGELAEAATRDVIAKQLQNFTAFVRKLQAGAAAQARCVSAIRRGARAKFSMRMRQVRRARLASPNPTASHQAWKAPDKTGISSATTR